MATWGTTEWVPAGIVRGLDAPGGEFAYSHGGMEFSPDGTILYVATDRQIWTVTGADHTASVFAGSGAAGHTDGTGTAATFSGAAALACDPSGNVYVGDEGGLVRKITPAGVVSTAFSGTSPIYDLTCDDSGNVYVAAPYESAVFKIAPDGVTSTLVILPDGGGGSTIEYDPNSGDLFVADWTNRVLLRVTTAGVVTTLAALGDDPDGDPIYAAFDQSGVLNITCQNWQANTPGMNTSLRHILRYSPLTGGWLEPVVLDLGWFTYPSGAQFLEQVIGIACSATGDIVIGYQHDSRIDQLLSVSAVLHTVGGHFRSVGGAQINMMQQPGLGPWLPIQDS